ncbi:MAG: MAPEG family protein [Rhizobiaceae bacterium]|nr:MAPEG family protein [Rhizobiaceae bacterium]
MIFHITPIYALAVALIYLALWFRVTKMRSELDLSIGDNGNQDLLLRVRQHGNCAEWSTFILILMMLAEGTGTPALYLHIAGALLLLGRIAHPFGLKAETTSHVLRLVGNGANILSALTVMVWLFIKLLDL